jgi:hypothetical protein
MRYEGLVYVSGSMKAWATIEDVNAAEWCGVIREIRGVDGHSGLHTLRIGEGESTGAFAVVEIDYDEELRSGILAGRTPFEPDPRPI